MTTSQVSPLPKFKRVVPPKYLIFGMTLLFSPSLIHGLPHHAKTVSGQAHITSGPDGMKIEASDGALIDYHDFSIASGESVTFIQPHEKATVLNRVISEKRSVIEGALRGNGRVFLVNPNGVYFGEGAKVDVGALVVSTLDLARQEEEGEWLHFVAREGLEAKIENQGLLTAKEGIFFISPYIEERGKTRVEGGAVALLSSQVVDVRLSKDEPISFLIPASSEQVWMKERQEYPLTLLAKEVVNIEEERAANQITVDEQGEWQLTRSTGALTLSGTVDVSSQKGEGGRVTLIADLISLEGGQILANGATRGGEVHVGGGYQGGEGLPRASEVLMKKGSAIFADAVERGEGGRVVLFSQERTRFDGLISVRGGKEGGDGGLAETSSSGSLESRLGSIDAFAPSGKVGTWLLDPTNLQIVSYGAASYPDVCCTATTVGDYSISNATLNAVVANVCVAASNSIVVAEDINLTTPSAGITFQPTSSTCTINTIVYNNINTNGGAITFVSGGAAGVNSVVIASSIQMNPGGGVISFEGPVDSCDDDSLTIANAAEVTFWDKVGAAQPLETLTIGASATTFYGDVYVEGMGAIFNTPVWIANDIEMIVNSNPGILFSSTINSATGTTSALSLEAPSGNVIFKGDVGGIYPLGDLSVSCRGPISFSNVGSLSTYDGAILFDANTQIVGADLAIKTTARGAVGEDVSFQGTVNSASHQALSVDAGVGEVTLGGAVGVRGSMGSLSFMGAGGLSLFGNVITRGAPMLFSGPITLEGDVFFDTTSGGVTSAGNNIIFSGTATTIDGAYNCRLNLGTQGNLTTGGEVGGVVPPLSFNVRATSTVISSNITTSGNTVIFDSDVVLAEDVVITDHGTSGVFFRGTLNSDGRARALTVNAELGSAEFVGSVGESSPLGNVAIHSKTIKQCQNFVLDPNASLEYSAPREILIEGDITAPGTGTLLFSDPVTFPKVSSVSGGERIELHGTLGKGNLSLTGNEVLFTSPSVKIGSLTITSDSLTLPRSSAVIANRLISLDVTGPLTLDADLTALQGRILIDQKIPAAAPGSVQLGGAIKTKEASVSFQGPVTLLRNLLFSASLGSGLAFLDTVEGLSASHTYDLTLSAGLGDLLFAKGATGLGRLWITNANHVSLFSTLSAEGLIQQDGLASTILDELIIRGPLGMNVSSQSIVGSGTLSVLDGDLVLNSFYTSIGSSASPLSLSASGNLFVGAYPNAYFSGNVTGAICKVKSNPPCYTYLNGTLVDIPTRCSCN